MQHGFALSEAAALGQAQRVRGLIQAGADIEARRDLNVDHGAFFSGLTPLMEAAGCSQSNVETVRVLLEAHADIHAISAGGVTAVWYAAGGGWRYDDLVFTRVTGSGFYPFGGGDAARLAALLDAGGNPNDVASNGRSALSEACAAGDPERVRMLLKHGAALMPEPPKRTGKKGVGEALFEKTMDMVGKALGSGEINPLFSAAESGSEECVRLILDAGFPANFSSGGRSALHHATTAEVAKLLIERGASVDKRAPLYGDPLEEALSEGRYEVAEFLLSHGACVEGNDPEFSRARAFCQRRNAKAVEMLLDAGASMEPDCKGYTLLHTACWPGEMEDEEENAGARDVIRLLLNRGAHVNARDKFGRTPLHEAVSGDWASHTAVRELLEHGAEPDPQDDQGNTPLALAAGTRHVECVRLLLAAGADPRLPDKNGRTPLDKSAPAEVSNLVTRLLDRLFPSNPDTARESEEKERECRELLQEAANSRRR